MNETAVLKALQTGAIAAVAASTAPNIPIKAVGRTLSPSPSKYWEFVHINNNSENDYWGEEKLYRGIFRLILHWPVDDAGVYPATSIVDSVASYFTKNLALWSGTTRVQIYDHPNAGSAIESGAELLFPLSLPYRSFSKG